MKLNTRSRGFVTVMWMVIAALLPAGVALFADRAYSAVTLDPPVVNVGTTVALDAVISVTPSPCCTAPEYIWTFTPLPSGTPITATRSGVQLELATVDGLQIGSYDLAVHASSGPDTSPDTHVTIALVYGSLGGIRVYPNPWRSDRDSQVNITFDHLSEGVQVKLFDMSAQWVRTLDATSDFVTWDRRNHRGDLVASGMYFYLITDNRGGRARGKLTIIK